MALHRSLGLGEVHISYNWEYADAAARTGATGLVTGDVGKLARQLDENSLWLLTNHSPVTWVAISGANDLTADAHKTLRQLIHFIDNGPAEGFASGAYRVNSGGIFPTAITWYTDSTPSKKKIVEKLLTWTGPNPTTIIWKMYDSSETLLVTITDTISYTGPAETSRTRVLS
jgi:hypothetical protein